MSERKSEFLPEPGEHALIVGQNGSGKTAFACWLLMRVPVTPTLILDTKIEPKFTKLPASVVVHSLEDAIKEYNNKEIDYVIIRPPVHLMAEPMELDNWLWTIYHETKDCIIYIDEAYTFHANGRAGKGLVALFTRGRSKGLNTIISTQRPVLISRFCVTEAKKVYAFRLADLADRKRLGDVIPEYSKMPLPPIHSFYFYVSGEDRPKLYKPVKLDTDFDTGYTDRSQSELVEAGSTKEEAKLGPLAHTWI